MSDTEGHICLWQVGHGSNFNKPIMVCIDPDYEVFVHKIVFIFLAIPLNMCFGCSKELSH